MPQIRLIHWNEKEAEEKVRELQSAGLEVIYQPIDPAGIRAMRESPPEAVIIDLNRLPSQGRDMGINLRISKSTRKVPLIFVGGQEDKVNKVMELIPDATYTTWEKILEDLDEAITNPPENPVVPESIMAAYSGTPLAKKLGIKSGSTIALVAAPEEFEITLGELPDEAQLLRGISDSCTLVLWFVRSQAELENGIKKMGKYGRGGRLWIIWPKKASGVVSDLTQATVRRAGLDNGLVDFKISSINDTWSGLLFTQRKQR